MNIAIVNCFDTYEHRVDLLVNYFKSHDYNVKVYTSNYRHIEKRKRNDSKQNFIYLETIQYKKNLSVQRMYSHFKLSKDIFGRLEYQNIDLLWVLIPPNSFVKDAAKYKEKHPNVKLIFDVIDMWPETMPINKIKNLYPIRKWQALRDKNISIADHVVTECDLFQKKIIQSVDKEKMTTLYLAREIRPFNSIPNPPDDNISLCYLGSINNIIDIQTVETIIKKIMIEKPVILHIIGDGENRNKLIEKIRNLGVEVIFHGKIYDMNEKQKIFDKCHFGLNIMKDSVFVGLTMKSMDYFESGLPIINNIKGDTWELIEKYNLGINLIDIDKFKLNITNRENIRIFFETKLSYQLFCKTIDKILNNI